MAEMAVSPTLAARIDAITPFLAAIQQDGAGRWAGGERLPTGAFVMPWFHYSDKATEWIDACYAHAWVDREFEWMNWQAVAAECYYPDTPQLRAAPVEVLRQLITLHIRKDRFVEGHLAAMITSGHIAAILRRLEAIRRGLRALDADG